MTTPSNNNHRLTRIPLVAGRWSHVAQGLSSWHNKFQKPPAHGFVGDVQSPFPQDIVYVSIAQSEASAEPHGGANDISWKSLAGEGEGEGLHPDMLH